MAGCGAAAEEEPEEQAQFVSPGQVMQRFREATGKRVLRRAAPDAAWEQLGLGLDPSPELVQEYGTFVVYVVKPGRGEAVGSLLRDKSTGKRLKRDARGIYWERDTLSDTWVANKRYGPNIVLAWFSDSTERATDARFTRVDRILSGLDTR